MTEFTASQKRKYLARVLRMNPLSESEKIIAFRATILGKTAENKQLPDNSVQQLRQNATRKIEELRKRFWTTPQNQLLQELQSIDVSQLPDMQHSVARLQTIARLLPQFEKLAQHPQTRINLVNTIKRMIMMSPREAGSVKAAYLRKASYASALPIVQNMIVMMHSEFPQIYDLESDWFYEISKLKRRTQ